MGNAIGAASVVFALVVGCGGSQAKVSEPTSVVADAGVEASAVAVERRFAATAAEAQTMIADEIAARMTVLWKCAEDYRTRVGDPHRAVTFDVGIDQEGHLIGLTGADSKHADIEPALRVCLVDSLRGAPFPRSHAGVITVRQVLRDATIR